MVIWESLHMEQSEGFVLLANKKRKNEKKKKKKKRGFQSYQIFVWLKTSVKTMT